MEMEGREVGTATGEEKIDDGESGRESCEESKRSPG